MPRDISQSSLNPPAALNSGDLARAIEGNRARRRIADQRRDGPARRFFGHGVIAGPRVEQDAVDVEDDAAHPREQAHGAAPRASPRETRRWPRARRCSRAARCEPKRRGDVADEHAAAEERRVQLAGGASRCSKSRKFAPEGCTVRPSSRSSRATRSRSRDQPRPLRDQRGALHQRARRQAGRARSGCREAAPCAARRRAKARPACSRRAGPRPPAPWRRCGRAPARMLPQERRRNPARRSRGRPRRCRAGTARLRGQRLRVAAARASCRSDCWASRSAPASRLRAASISSATGKWNSPAAACAAAPRPPSRPAPGPAARRARTRASRPRPCRPARCRRRAGAAAAR